MVKEITGQEVTNIYYQLCVKRVEQLGLVGKKITLIKFDKEYRLVPLEEPGDTVIFRGMLKDERGFVFALVSKPDNLCECRAASTGEVEELNSVIWEV